ncbi:MAG: DoxX family membrane protein [Candidatus Korobacteraceae bacterium]
MLSPVNFWMSFAGLIYLAAGVFILRKEISAARGWDKLITFGCVFIAVSLAVFAPEHFHGPEFVQSMVPSWMPAHWFWPKFVGCALLAAATSLTVRKFVRLSSSLLGLMFFLFVCMIYLPGAFAQPKDRFAWTYALRDLSFAAGAWALAGLHSRAASPQLSKWMILFGRVALAIAAIFFGVEHFLHPEFAPGVPLEKMTPSWVPLPSVWGYLAGAILPAAGIGLALNKKSRLAAASIGAFMTALTLFLYLPILIIAHGGAAPEFNEALNYVADTLLYAGAALALASALPRDPDRMEQT